MSDDGHDNDSKTDYVSARRTREAWEQGRIPLGRDAAGVAAMGGALLALFAVAPRLATSLTSLCRQALNADADATVSEVLTSAVEPGLLGVLVLAAAAGAALAATLAQTRGGMWAELALPDAERLWSGRLTQAFSKQFWVDLSLMVVKVVVVLGVSWMAIRDDLLSLPRLLLVSPTAQLTSAWAPVGRLAVSSLAVLAGFAVADLALTHLRFRDKMKMTKEEAKRELKEDEGDPLLRSRRKKRARELARGRIAIEVPRADAVVVNPTHVAVAIRYRRDEGNAPRVIAKGKGQVAENIRELARSNGVPIVEDIMLARLLYRRVKIGGSIPAETYRAVAAILAFVYRVTGRNPSATPAREEVRA